MPMKFLFFRKDARLPEQLQRAMAAEAEASREARAKVIAADGEMRASKALREASIIIEQSPAALQLRYLQVLQTEHKGEEICGQTLPIVNHNMAERKPLLALF